MPYAKHVKDTLLTLISQMASNVECYVKDSTRDFTRNRKLSFQTMLTALISMEGRTLNDELRALFSSDPDYPSKSAFCQQRGKLKIEAFQDLFQLFVNAFPSQKTWNGYKILAADGCVTNIYKNPAEKENYFEQKNGKGGFSQLHPVYLYDLLNKTYNDIEILPGRTYNEGQGLCSMIDRYQSTQKTIVIADRGFPAFNVFAHFEEQKLPYLIRSANLRANNSMFKHCYFPDTDEFDEWQTITITRSCKKYYRLHPEIYKCIANKTNFDYIEKDDKSSTYTLSLRLVRIKLDNGTYEDLITNLPADEFPPSVIKELYGFRWKEETSFRELKYAVGLINFHSKKTEYVKQEIYARLVLYNFNEHIISDIVVEKKSNNQHEYQLNFTQAMHIIRDFLSGRNGVGIKNVRCLIERNLEPVRPGRSFNRKINRSKRFISFLYRI